LPARTCSEEKMGGGTGDRELERSRAETRAAFASRALMYATILSELEAEIGIERAVEVMKRAIYRRGLEIGESYRPAVEAGDLEEVGRLFVGRSPADGSLFEPAIDEPASDGRIVLRMTGCPLVDAWREAGYDEERVDLMCEVAAAVDHGTFEGAGLELEFLDRQACPGSDTCRLELKIPG
jgi:hypothetical protein